MRPTTLARQSILLAVLGVAATATGQTSAAPGPTGLLDGAKMFTPRAAAEAEKVLRDVEKESRWQTRIETVTSLGGVSPSQFAVDAAKKAGVRGVYMLIAKNETKIQVEPSNSARTLFGPSVRELIVSSFVDAAKHPGKGESGVDIGLRHVVAVIRRVALGYGVLDHAKLFDETREGLVNHALNKIRERRQVVVETVVSLDGKPVNEAATARAKALQVRGVYVVIAKNDRKFYVEPSDSARKDFPPERTKAITEATLSAFKAQDDPQRYDKGLTEAVALIGKDLGITRAELTEAPFHDTADDSPGGDELALAETEKKPVAKEKPTDATVNPLVPAAQPPSQPPTPGPAPGPVPAASGDPAEGPAARGGSVAPLVLGGLGVVIALWLLSRLFRRPSVPAQPSRPAYGPGAGPAPAPAPGYGQPGSAPPPGPRPGYGPPPAPGYGPPPAPGYGYGPPPPAGGGGGGGLVSGALGGLGGAIVGNILYDKFGRPHPAEPGVDVPHVHGAGAGALPPEGGRWPDPDDVGAAPAPETYNPDAGTGGDWGTPDASQDPSAEPDGSDQETPEASEDEPVGGDWSSPEPDQPEEPAGGDWSSDAPEPEPEPEQPDDSGGGDENQGGSW